MNHNEADNSGLNEFLAALPKVELHVHLEGSVRPETLLALAARNEIDLGVANEAELRRRYVFTDFPQFVEVYVMVCDCLRSGADFELITRELGAGAARQNIVYVETTFTPARHVRPELPFEEIMDGLAAGADAARREYGVEIRFIPDYPRDFGVKGAWQTLAWAKAGMNRGVVALGLSGMENEVPSPPFGQVAHAAQEAGLFFAPHAGEIAGAQVVWDVLAMGADRIGHGIHAADDPQLLAALAASGTPLEVCPTSNLCTGAVAALDQHPLRKLWDAGVVVTLNSDDPPMFNTDLTNEYSLAARHFGFSKSELARLSLNGVRAAFMPAIAKAELERSFRSRFAALGLDEYAAQG